MVERLKMVKKSFNVEVEPEVVKWAIKSSGYTIEELSKKLNCSENTIEGWLEGRKQPTLRQVENLSKYLKRPLAVFFLSKPPEEKPLPKDYRLLPGKEGVFDTKTILAIRTARRLQEVSKELAENLHQEIKQDISSADLTDNPKKIAENYRNILQITERDQKKWKTPNEAFNALRELIESRNIIVFQIPMSVKDAGGFALPDDTPSVIVVNSKDQIKRRIFTLMHEFGHILLKKPGIDMPENALFGTNNIDAVEKWCNEFAAAFLLPENVAKDIFDQNRMTLTETKTLDRLSTGYKLSKAMLLYNMWKLNYITSTQYKEVLGRPQKEKNKNYLFSWDDIPGNDNRRLLDYLMKSLKIDWAKNAEIKKKENGKTIAVTKGENSLKLKLNEKEGKVLLEIVGGKTYKYILKKENSKLNIYKTGGGLPPDIRCIREKGGKFISLVSANFENKFITNRDALDYLSIKSRYYDKILPKIRG